MNFQEFIGMAKSCKDRRYLGQGRVSGQVMVGRRFNAGTGRPPQHGRRVSDALIERPWPRAHQGVANATPTTLRCRLQAMNGLPTVKASLTRRRLRNIIATRVNSWNLISLRLRGLIEDLKISRKEPLKRLSHWCGVSTLARSVSEVCPSPTPRISVKFASPFFKKRSVG